MTDVLILGDGPAGLGAAIILGQKGRKVTVVQRKNSGYNVRAGESLTSSALTSLKELDLAEEFLRDAHEPCHGNSSCWGNNKLSYFDFIQSPNGSGWYVDRPKFNRMLLCKAQITGVDFLASGRTADLVRSPDDTWLYSPGTHDGPAIPARFIIDASGRNSWLSRRLDVQRITEDDQIAVITLLKAEHLVKSYHSLIEAAEDGWWYVADADNITTACVFFTDPGLHKRSDLLDPAYLNFKKEKTLFVKNRIPANSCPYIGSPALTAAGSVYSAQFSGNGWFVAGDAACSMDPLSSHGISFALRSGIDAGHAINAALDGSLSAAGQYNNTLQQAISIYSGQRLKIYQLENRWPTSLYWQRRHNIIPR